MKKKWSIICALAAAALLWLTVPMQATSSLGAWNEGAPGSTHEFWHFTPGHIITSVSGYTADPENVFNPEPNRVAATITPMSTGSWDGVTNITASSFISVNLEIPNYEILNEWKEVWVDVGNLSVSGITVSATDGGSTTFTYQVLGGQGDAEFGIKIWPNPYVEKIGFYVTSPVVGQQVVLDYIHVDTMCPEPTTMCIFGIGTVLLLSKKRQ